MAAAGAGSTGSKMAYRVAEISEFGFLELLPQQQQKDQQQAPQPAQPQQQQRDQQQTQQQAPQPACQQAADAGALLLGKGPAVGGASSESSDPGHLQCGGGYQSARAAALRRPGSSSSVSSSGTDRSAPITPQIQVK